MSRKRFALDQNFPEPIVAALKDSIVEAELVPVRQIDVRLTTMDDWELLLALHHHPEQWDGLITTDSKLLSLPRELSVLMQTKLTLVVAESVGHDPVKATGLVLTHLDRICSLTDPGKVQVFALRAGTPPAKDAWDLLDRVAEHRGTSAPSLYQANKLTRSEFNTNPLA